MIRATLAAIAALTLGLGVRGNVTPHAINSSVGVSSETSAATDISLNSEHRLRLLPRIGISSNAATNTTADVQTDVNGQTNEKSQPAVEGATDISASTQADADVSVQLPRSVELHIDGSRETNAASHSILSIGL